MIKDIRLVLLVVLLIVTSMANATVSETNGPVHAIVLQPDGKVVVGGTFSRIDEIDRVTIARLNSNGSVDTSFDLGTGVASSFNVPWLRTIALQPDGKIVIGGYFTEIDGTNRKNIARLNADGSLDIDFDPGSGPNGNVVAISLQPDGKLLLGGIFTQFNGTDRNAIARLNNNGSLDTSFDPGTGADFIVNRGRSIIQTLAIQPDSKVLVGGRFISFNGINRSRMARLNDDGSLDSDFVSGASNQVLTIVLQPDNKVLLGGSFNSVNGIIRNHIVRLNPDGSLDTSFDASTNDEVYSLALQPDGRVIVGGKFTSINGKNRNYIARLYSDGSLDTGFDAEASLYVYALAVQPDGKILMGGLFSKVNGIDRNYLARLKADGSLDEHVTSLPFLLPLLLGN